MVCDRKQGGRGNEDEAQLFSHPHHSEQNVGDGQERVFSMYYSTQSRCKSFAMLLLGSLGRSQQKMDACLQRLTVARASCPRDAISRVQRVFMYATRRHGRYFFRDQQTTTAVACPFSYLGRDSNCPCHHRSTTRRTPLWRLPSKTTCASVSPVTHVRSGDVARNSNTDIP